MKIKTNTNIIRLFSGCYNSYWELIEYSDKGNEIETDYDFKDFMDSILAVYKENEKMIVDELGIDWIESISFTGHWSPREYNFKTDELDFDLVVNRTKMIDAVKELCRTTRFADFLKEKYSGGDGHISFTPDNPLELLNAIQYETDELDQAIGAVITYLAKDNLDDIESLVRDDWSQNGYGGLDYDLIAGDDNLCPMCGSAKHEKTGDICMCDCGISYKLNTI